MPTRQQGTRDLARKAAENSDGDAALAALLDVGKFALLSMVGASRAFNECVRRLGRIAIRDAAVLIDGETGSGKEMAARAIHYLGARRDRPFVPVNCGGIPDSLIEAEFFGHGRGAFTDAREPRAGLIAQAQGGTLFLDEINALSPRAQVALLRFLQDQRYRPVGRDVELKADVRIIAATNKPLRELLKGDTFRGDLLYRLNILYLYIPPLRERDGDAELLAQHFLRQYAAKYQLPLRPLSPATLRWIRCCDWPGNVRELENTIHREFLLADGDFVEFGELPTQKSCDIAANINAASELVGLDFRTAKARVIEDFERTYLSRTLQLAQGNISEAARIAKKERRAFGKLLKKYGIHRMQFH